MANTSWSWRQFIVHLTILVIFVYCMKAVQAQPPEPPPGPSTSPGDSTQPVPGDAGQPDAGPLLAGGGGAEGVDDIKPEGAGGAVTSTDGAWGGENTTSSALDAVQPLPENQERQSRREQWMREMAVASDGSLHRGLTGDDREEGQEEDQGHNLEAGQGDANVSGQNSASHSISSHEAVQVQPPGPSLSPADSTQPVPGDAGQPNAGPLAAGGSGAEGGDDIKPEGGAGTSPDGAWGGANTTSGALDAVQPLAENPERQSRREQWMRERADPGSDALSQGHVQLEDQEGAELNTNNVASLASAAAPQEVSAESTLGIHARDGAGLCAPPDTLDYGQNHSIHPQSHCDPWLNIHIRCGYDIQHPDLGDSEYVDLAWERSQRAAARRHRRGGQRPWNIQPEDDSTRTVDMQQARRPRRIMQGGVLLLVLLQVLMVMYMVLVFDIVLLHASLNGHLQGNCRNAQYAVMDFRLLQVVVCLLVLAIWIIM